MEQLQNFGPNDVSNGTLAQMFRNAGINDVRSYVDVVRQEDLDLNNQSNQLGSSSNNVQLTSDKTSNRKNGLNNVKQVYQMYKSLDKNGDGKITVEDVEILLKEMGLGFVSKYLARAIFDIVDTNHNGRLEFRDVIALASVLKRLSTSSSSSSSSPSNRF